VPFHYQIIASNHRYNTWHGAEAQIWWSDLKTGTAVPLATLNGFDAKTMTLLTYASIKALNANVPAQEKQSGKTAAGGYNRSPPLSPPPPPSSNPEPPPSSKPPPELSKSP